MIIGRRGAVLFGIGMAVAPFWARAEALPKLQVWRDAGCGCCGAWVEHMRAAGFPVEDNVVASVASARRMLGTPADLLSCHAGRVDSYVLEGHVPALAVKRLLASRPATIRGLAVPAMPTGSPGMEVPGQAPDNYDVIAFDSNGGRMSFMRFRGSEPA